MAAAQFALCGFDVSVQYGANQPEYDLIVAKGDELLKVSVKGSQDGSWGLTQSDIENADYHEAVDKWLKRHGSHTVFCLVQFQNVELNQLPRMYLATPTEIANRLKEARTGLGDTILREHHEFRSGKAAGCVDRIPESSRFTTQRIDELLAGRERSAVSKILV